MKMLDDFSVKTHLKLLVMPLPSQPLISRVFARYFILKPCEVSDYAP